MHRDLNPLIPRNLLISWLLAMFAIPLTLVAAAAGQGIGAWFGGCSWIGITLPLGRPVWALVNEPSIHFASLGTADGYWLGSLILPLLLALLAPGFIPRARTAGAELLMIQLAWASAFAGLAWLPLLDLTDSHLSHWLDFHRLGQHWIWVAPAVAGLIALLAANRLTKLLVTASPHAGSGTRVTAAVLHLWLPAAGWMLLVGIVSGPLSHRAVAAAAIPCGAVALGALLARPVGHSRPLEPVNTRTWVYGLTAVFLTGALVWVAGRPLPNQHNAGLLWGRPLATNNIRSWVTPKRLFSRQTGIERPREDLP